MIPRIFSLVLVVIAIGGCSSSSDNASAGDDGSNTNGSAGNDDVQTIRLVSKQRIDDDGDTRTTTYEYDAAGNLTGLSFNNDFLFATTTHIYNITADGQIIDEVINLDGMPKLAPPNAYYYDPVGGLRRIDTTNNSGVAAIQLYKFDGSIATNYEFRMFDNPVNVNSVDENAGRFLLKIEYQYEENRLARELIDSDGDGVVDSQLDYSYNSNGTVSTALKLGASSSSTTFTYERGACNNNWGNSTHAHFCVVDSSL